MTRTVEYLPPGKGNSSLRPFRRRGFGVIATAAFLGAAAGMAGVFLSGRPPDVAAAYTAAQDLRDAPLAGASGSRAELIARIAALGASERLPPPMKAEKSGAARPKLVIIFDDMGPDRAAFRKIMAMPGPVTLSFLPYAPEIQPLVDEARGRGDAILLHLPMEPSGAADPGPHSLETSMRPDRLFEALAWNLDQFEGYSGVNNHMGSKFTRDSQAMKRVLSMLDQQGLFFVDSLTTGGSVAASAGASVGAEVFARDVFLDAEPGRETVARQLALAEAIAVKTGYAIVIGHPRSETLDVIGPWLTTAPSRGFELATVTALREHSPLAVAAAP